MQKICDRMAHAMRFLSSQSNLLQKVFLTFNCSKTYKLILTNPCDAYVRDGPDSKSNTCPISVWPDQSKPRCSTSKKAVRRNRGLGHSRSLKLTFDRLHVCECLLTFDCNYGSWVVSELQRNFCVKHNIYMPHYYLTRRQNFPSYILYGKTRMMGLYRPIKRFCDRLVNMFWVWQCGFISFTVYFFTFSIVLSMRTWL